jgi:hypothetical protein
MAHHSVQALGASGVVAGVRGGPAARVAEAGEGGADAFDLATALAPRTFGSLPLGGTGDAPTQGSSYAIDSHLSLNPPAAYPDPAGVNPTNG